MSVSVLLASLETLMLDAPTLMSALLECTTDAKTIPIVSILLVLTIVIAMMDMKVTPILAAQMLMNV